MVGVPRSKGCRICVQRRVRCDQTRPTCNNCKKGNRPCPGYGQDLKFQDEGARLRKRYHGSDIKGTVGEISAVSSEQEGNGSVSVRNSHSVTSGGTPREVSPGTDSGDDSNDALVSTKTQDNHWDVVGLDVGKTDRRTFLGLLEGKSELYAQLADSLPEGSLFEFPIHLGDENYLPAPDRFLVNSFSGKSVYNHISDADLAQKQLVTVFKESLFPDNGTVPDALKNHARWLAYLPPLTGTNALLDASVRAVALVQIGRLNDSEPFIMESRPYYGQALRLLNKTLQDRKSGMSNETLCAVILLSFYEMFASDNNDSWVRHAGGVSALMRARGPHRHRRGFDREIFLAYRFTLIIESFQEDVPCFLAEPAWKKLSADIHADLKKIGVSADRLEIFELAEEFYVSMVDLPEICACARAFGRARQTNSPQPYNRAQLIDRIAQHRAQFKATFARFEAALKRAGHAPTINLNHRDPLIGIEYEFINTFVSATYTGYWTVLTVLNLCSQGLQHDDQELVSLYRTENRDCGLNICRSSTYTLKSSFLGPFFLIFGLRSALLVFEDTDGPEADWILRKLFEIGDRHLGIAKHVPGYRAGITVEELIREFKTRKAKSFESTNASEQMEFMRQVSMGDVSHDDEIGMEATSSSGGFDPTGSHGSTNGAHKLSSSWQGLTHVDDVLKAWEDQDNFELQTNMHNLNVDSTSAQASRGPSPLPSGSIAQEQQFSRAAAAFAMPDMSFFDQSFPQANPTFDGVLETDDELPMDFGQHVSHTYHTTPNNTQRPTPVRKNTLPRGLERFFEP